ncbi:xanthine dehydrogenase family protein molybdopterin-binding subunit [Gemmatimonadota bacterium]
MDKTTKNAAQGRTKEEGSPVPKPPHQVLGMPLKGGEDPALLKGEAAFVADLELPGMLHMEFLRSEYAHAKIISVDTSAAEKMPGVVRVITAKDLGSMMGLPCIWVPGGAESHFPSHPFGVPGGSVVLADDRVLYIGDPVAVVVAETRYQAMDALEAIQVSYQPLPVVIDAEAAYQEGAPQLHPEVSRNLNAYIPYGDQEGTDKAIAEAEVVITQNVHVPRTINSPLEPRGAVGQYDPGSEEYTLWATSQSVHNHRLLLALMILGIPYNKLRVIAPNIGGSFGTKGYVYPDMPLVLFLAKQLGRPIKWVDSRRGLMRSTVQGRDQKMTGTIAGTRDGKITALRCTSYANLGAYPSTIGPGVATAMVGRCITGCYDIEHAFCEIYAMFTNTVSLGAQRGSGRAEATILHERMIDLFAREIGMDPGEVRRKNLVKPEQMPFDNRMGWEYDSGDYPAAFEKALEMIEYSSFADRKAAAREQGKLLGIGMDCFVAVSGVGPSPRMAQEGMLGGTWESANVQVHPTGEVTVAIGSVPHGQYHETTFAQIVAEELGVEMSKIKVVHSDTKDVPFGQGSYGSRSFSVGGAAVLKAAQNVKAKAIGGAAHTLGVAEVDVVYDEEHGKLYPKHHPEKALTLQEVALGLWYGWDIPSDMEPSLEHTSFLDPPGFNFPYGSHVAEVAIDEKTGQVEVTRYVGVNDVGVMGNPLVVEGQVHGAITFGFGEAMLEEAKYSDDGRLLTTTLGEYALPRATQLPHFELASMETPTPHTALGAKGAGEVGTVGAAPALSNAVCNALADLGVTHLDVPMTPEKIWKAIQDGKQGDK